jgi:hypothetical protein
VAVDQIRSRALTALVWLAGAYLLWLTARYLLQAATVQRHHLESASFVFVAILLLSAALRQQSPDLSAEESLKPLRFGGPAVAGVAGAVLLYYPVIGSGLFADDFGLLHAAREGRWTVWSDLFRPMLFLVWRGLDGLTTHVAPWLHATNIVLHGLNAAMVALLASQIGLSRGAAVMAGSLFLCFPAAVEAVTWPAGFQDVGMTTLVLAFLLASGRSEQTPVSVVVAMVCVLAACVTKETAVVAPLLAVLLAIASGHRNVRTIALSVAAVAVFLAVRFTFLPLPPALTPASRYALKEFLVRPFASLLVPFRASEVVAHPIVIWMLVAFVVVGLCVSIRRWGRGDRSLAAGIALTAFVTCSVLPLARIFVVLDDLQGSRYLYLGTAAWVLLLATLFARADRRLSLRGAASAAVIVVCWIVATRAHQRQWLAAGEVRDRILSAVSTLPGDCERTAVYGLPEVRDGVPIFLNGFHEAAGSSKPGHAFRIAPDVLQPGECHFTWDGTALRRQSR